MALTIRTPFKTINLSRQMLFTRMRTNSYVLAPAVRASALITINEVINTESQFDFLFTDESGTFGITIRFRNSPSQPYDIPISGGSAPTTTGGFAQAILNIFTQNARFTNSFNVNVISTSIIIIVANNFSTQLAYLPSYFGNQYTVNYINAQSAHTDLRNDFKIVANLFVFENIFNSFKIDTQNIIPEFTEGNLVLNAEAEIDFQSIAEVQHLPEVLPASNTDPFIHEEALKRLKVTIAEYYDGDYQDFIAVNNIYTLDAEIEQKDFQALSLYCDALLNAPFPFLTKLKKYKIKNDSKYWLSILIPAGQKFKVKFTPIRFDDLPTDFDDSDFDGSDFYVNDTPQPIVSAEYENTSGHPKVYRIPCGIDQIAWANEYIYEYQVALINQADALISSTFNIEVDQRYLGDELTFVYKNNFGVYMLLRAKGEFDYNLKTDFEQIKKHKRNLDSLQTFETVNVSVDKVHEVNCNIGHQNKTQNMALAEFLASKEVYLFKNDKYYPITLGNSDEKIYGNLNNLENIEFDFIYSFDKFIE